MHTFFKHSLPVLLALLLGATAPARAGLVLADWQFAESAATTLNNTVNSGAGLNGPGSSWNVAITGVGSDGAGQLLLANDGKGGSGTRSAYADFGPAFDQISSGTLSLLVRLGSWGGAPAGAGQSIWFDFIEGNDFLGAGMELAADGAGFHLGGRIDPFGDGGALAGGASFTSAAPLTLRLDLHLDTLRYGLGYDAGAGFVSLGVAYMDSLTEGINSLRLGSAGDFSANPLALDRLWVEWEATSVPEPASPALLLAGLLAAACLRRRSA
jgi:hypothetical protein